MFLTASKHLVKNILLHTTEKTQNGRKKRHYSRGRVKTTFSQFSSDKITIHTQYSYNSWRPPHDSSLYSTSTVLQITILELQTQYKYCKHNICIAHTICVLHTQYVYCTQSLQYQISFAIQAQYQAQYQQLRKLL